MTTLYLDLGMGAAGDMLAAALLELLPRRRAEFLTTLNSLGLDGVQVSASPSVKCGISGTRVNVTVHGRVEQSIDVADHQLLAEPGARHDYHGAARPDGHDHDHDHDHDHVLAHDHSSVPHDHDHDHDHVLAHDHSSVPHDHDHDHVLAHDHGSLPQIEQIVSSLELPSQVRTDVIGVYQLLAEAEAAVHNKPVEQVHFHEVGQADAIADIVAVCLLLSWLAPTKILASPVHVGSGKVRCAHGIMPVPAPATERLLRGIPIYGGQINGELCTPTGAALLKYFVDEFSPTMPAFMVEAAGYGMGSKDFEAANCVRALLGELVADKPVEQMLELSCNLDDMTGEAIGYAQQQLFSAGAVEVFTTAVTMKKGRPGVLLSCLCPVAARDEVVRALFAHTTTIGIREYECRRHLLEREQTVVTTRYGQVRLKTVSGYGVRRSKPEYDDLAAIAQREGLPLSEVVAMVSATLNVPRR